MKTKLSRFDELMIAITFAEASEFDWAQELAESDKTSHEQQSSTQALPSGTMVPSHVAH